MREELCLKINNRSDYLERVFTTVDDLGSRENWPPGVVFKVRLALEELGINTIEYGFYKDTHEIQITFTSDEDTVTIEFRDDGRPFDPTSEAPLPDVDAAIEDRPMGGQGIHLVSSMMNHVSYRQENGMNCLTMTTSRTK